VLSIIASFGSSTQRASAVTLTAVGDATPVLSVIDRYYRP
jgi:hypothetical protein